MMGHFTVDREGNITGSQNRSVAGQSGVEDAAGPISVNRDGTAYTTLDVFVFIVFMVFQSF
jgi:flagellar basal body rod protein FlgG